MKKILAFALVILAVFCTLNVASAGLFDFLGTGSQPATNETYTFDGFTLDLPSNTSIANFTWNGTGYTVNTFIVSTPDDSYTVEVTRGSGAVDSAQEYASNWIDDGAALGGTYGNWTIINLNNATSGNQTYTGYILVNHDGKTMYEIRGDNLDALKNITDTFKKV